MADINLNVPAVEKLLDYAAIGIGAVAGPILAPWKATQEGKARLAAARFNAEVLQIESESRGQSLKINAEAQEQARRSLETTIDSERGKLEITREDIIQSIEFQGRKRLANAKAVVEDTAEELGGKEVEDHEPDPDWVARFFDYVQDVSSDDVRKIWTSILAGEVERPGRTSLRTLDTLRNMTKGDAVLFRGICDYVIEGRWIFFHDSLAQDIEALTYGRLIHLEDCGLLNAGSNLVRRYKWNDSGEILLSYQRGFLLMKGSAFSGDILSVPDVLLTTAGRELLQYVQSAPRWDYLQALSKFLIDKKVELFHLEGVSLLDNGQLQYSKRVQIEPRPD